MLQKLAPYIFVFALGIAVPFLFGKGCSSSNIEIGQQHIDSTLDISLPNLGPEQKNPKPVLYNHVATVNAHAFVDNTPVELPDSIPGNYTTQDTQHFWKAVLWCPLHNEIKDTFQLQAEPLLLPNGDTLIAAFTAPQNRFHAEVRKNLSDADKPKRPSIPDIRLFESHWTVGAGITINRYILVGGGYEAEVLNKIRVQAKAALITGEPYFFAYAGAEYKF